MVRAVVVKAVVMVVVMIMSKIVMCVLGGGIFFKASALWADAFFKSKCLSVCSLLRYRLTVFLPPLPEVRCQIFLEIRNPWGNVMERSGLTFEHFLFGNGLKSPCKKSFFFCWFCGL